MRISPALPIEQPVRRVLLSRFYTFQRLTDANRRSRVARLDGAFDLRIQSPTAMKLLPTPLLICAIVSIGLACAFTSKVGREKEISGPGEGPWKGGYRSGRGYTSYESPADAEKRRLEYLAKPESTKVRESIILGTIIFFVFWLVSYGLWLAYFDKENPSSQTVTEAATEGKPMTDTPKRERQPPTRMTLVIAFSTLASLIVFGYIGYWIAHLYVKTHRGADEWASYLCGLSLGAVFGVVLPLIGLRFLGSSASTNR